MAHTPAPEPSKKPSGVYGHVCPNCQHWTDHVGPAINEAGGLKIDLAAAPAVLYLMRELNTLERETRADRPVRTIRQIADKLAEIITEFEVRK